METRGLTAASRPRHGRARAVGRGQGAALQPARPRRSARSSRASHPLRRARGGRRLRRARRVLSRGLRGAVDGDAAGPAGAMDRGSARAPDGYQPLAAAVPRHRDRRSTRDGRIVALRRPLHRGPRRVHPHARGRGPRADGRAAARAVPDPALRVRGLVRADEQDADGDVSRARTLRGHVRPRAPASTSRRGRARARSGRAAAPQLHPGRARCRTRSAAPRSGSARSTTAATTTRRSTRRWRRSTTRRCAPSRPRARAQGRYVGIGVGCLLEKAGLGPWEYARVEVDATGHVVVYSGVAAVGQGIETTLAQVVRRRAGGCRRRTITVVHGDSARVPFGVGGFASRGAAVALPAALEAARKVRDKIVRVAASLLEAARRRSRPRQTARSTCAAAGPRGDVPRQLARAAVPGPPGMEPGLYAAHFFEAPKMTYPYGTHVAGRRGRRRDRPGDGPQVRRRPTTSAAPSIR